MACNAMAEVWEALTSCATPWLTCLKQKWFHPLWHFLYYYYYYFCSDCMEILTRSYDHVGQVASAQLIFRLYANLTHLSVLQKIWLKFTRNHVRIFRIVSVKHKILYWGFKAGYHFYKLVIQFHMLRTRRMSLVVIFFFPKKMGLKEFKFNLYREWKKLLKTYLIYVIYKQLYMAWDFVNYIQLALVCYYIFFF